MGHQMINMPYIGSIFDYELFRNSDGCIEGFKGIGLMADSKAFCRPAKDIERVVTLAKTKEEFAECILNLQQKPKIVRYNAKKDENQLKLTLDE